MSKPIVRFAPSPTGHIHIGNARVGPAERALARREGGTFILRFDDTDLARSKQEYADSIEADLDWLGIPPDVIVRQSERFALYDAAAERLKAVGRLYPCYETPEELEFRRKRQLARGLPPIYDRAALKLTDEEREALEKRGAQAPLALPPRPDERRLGRPRARPLPRGLQLALRSGAGARGRRPISTRCPPWSTTSTSSITHVIRGEDHVTNTAVQIQIFEALGRGRSRPSRITAC